jgi:hypothetical protein
MVDAVDCDVSGQESVEHTERVGSMNGSSVSILNDESEICCIRFETRQNEGFSLKHRKMGIEPLMSRISEVSFEYKHTESDGSSNSFKADVKLDKDVENSADTNNESDNSASDIDSRDRDFDKENG